MEHLKLKPDLGSLMPAQQAAAQPTGHIHIFEKFQGKRNKIAKYFVPKIQIKRAEYKLVKLVFPTKEGKKPINYLFKIAQKFKNSGFFLITQHIANTISAGLILYMYRMNQKGNRNHRYTFFISGKKNDVLNQTVMKETVVANCKFEYLTTKRNTHLKSY